MAVAANDDGLTDYERQRLAHVARNREYMARLGVMDLASKVAPPKTSSTSSKLAPGRKRVKREPTEPSRRSGRLLNAKPEHDGSAVDLLGDEEDGTGERGRKARAAVDRIATAPRETRATGTQKTQPSRRRGSGSRTRARSCR